MKNKKSFIIIIILCIIIGVLIGIINKKDDVKEEPSNISAGGIGLTVDPNATEYVPPKQEVKPTQGVAIPGWGSITIPANTTNVTVDFMNPEENTGFYYLTFELRLLKDNKEDYEVLYKSGLVEPGLHIQNITLSRSLVAGEYDAIIHVQPYRMDEAKTPTNNADMKTKLIVK